MKKETAGKAIRIILPLLHFALTFILERLILVFDKDYSFVSAIAMNNIISDGAERAIAYCVSKLFAGIIIFLLWKLLFYIIDCRFKEKFLWIFGGLFLVGLVLGFIVWPFSFTMSKDNYVTYMYAIRLAPEYWHNAYTSFALCAYLMVFPHPAAIMGFQWMGFVATIAYGYRRIEKSPVLKGKGKFLVFLLFLIPFTYRIFADPYRTEQYAILCLFYMILIIMDLIEKKKRPVWQLILLLILSAFIGVWRTEGVILGVLSMIAYCIFVREEKLKKTIVYTAIVLAAYLVISVPQKLGDAKYYGSDYTFINSFPTLRNILDNENANLYYDGVEQDIEAINAVVPIPLLKAYDMEGYRRYNYANKRPDINQSMAEKEAQEAYTGAYYRLLLHNIPIYLDTQIHMLLHCVGLPIATYEETYAITEEEDLPNWVFKAWDDGEADYFSSFKTYDWFMNEKRQKVAAVIMFSTIENGEKYLNKILVLPLFIIASVAFEFWIMLKEFINLCKKKKENAGFFAFAMIILMQGGAIFLVMPAAALCYFHSFLYCTFTLNTGYVLKKRLMKKNER